jgi:uncharacterized protein YkwD
MVNTLLTALTISICLLFFTAQLQPAFAQSKKQSTGYLYIVKQLIIVNQKTTVKGDRTATVPKATPTIYIKPEETPTSAPTKELAKELTPTPTKTLIKPSITVFPTKPPKPTITLTPVEAGGDAMSSIMSEINAYRASQGLPSVQTSGETCSFASTRAAEIVSNFSHDGFQSRIDSKTLPYSSWSAVTENIAMTSNYKDVVQMWINSPGHAANMRADTPFVCVRQSGNYYAYVGMKP